MFSLLYWAFVVDRLVMWLRLKYTIIAILTIFTQMQTVSIIISRVQLDAKSNQLVWAIYRRPHCYTLRFYNVKSLSVHVSVESKCCFFSPIVSIKFGLWQHSANNMQNICIKKLSFRRTTAHINQRSVCIIDD